MREHYRNGDPITIGNCNGCEPSMINGFLAHELNCPDAWRDRIQECRECGCKFQLTDRRQHTCTDCLNDLAD